MDIHVYRFVWFFLISNRKKIIFVTDWKQIQINEKTRSNKTRKEEHILRLNEYVMASGTVMVKKHNYDQKYAIVKI